MARRLDVTDRIVAADLCSGCGACAAVLPDHADMASSEEGFLRPVSDRLSRKAARTVLALCPGGGQEGGTSTPFSHPLWGGYFGVAKGWAVNSKLRFSGASGGALSAVLVNLLESGKVDGVVQVCADPDNPSGNQTIVSRDRSDVQACATSRYAPSAPLLEVPRLLELGGAYAFVGKPCDVAALRNWEKIDRRVAQVFPAKLSFFCAGVPSSRGAAAILQKLDVSERDVASFRYRGNGWPGRAEAKTHDGQSRFMSYAESWGDILSRHVQPRCKICADGSGMAADIAFGDAWQTDAAGYPLFEEQDGESLILARTKLGQSLLDAATVGGELQTVPMDIEQVAAMQPGQVRRRTELLGRLVGRIMAGMPVPRYRAMGIWDCARMVSPWSTARAALGMARRCIIRRQQS